MRILIATDAWHPQINGVVRTLSNTKSCLEDMGHFVKVLSPNGFKTINCPGYSEINLALFPYRKVKEMIREFNPTCIHIATEGPIGLAAKKFARKYNLRYTTAYHTRFPEYLEKYFHVPTKLTYRYMKWFHKHSAHVLAPTNSIKSALTEKGINRVAIWSRGVETAIFRPDVSREKNHVPVFLYVGRVSAEKNIEAFLDLELPGEKWVVGDGPELTRLQSEYPDTKFFGAKEKEELPHFYNRADVFVFPSLTDTFGLVMLEAMACGTPVAAFPAPGPIDVIESPISGIISKDLKKACLKALEIPRSSVARYAETFTWESATRTFYSYLVANGRTIKAELPIEIENRSVIKLS